MWLAGGPATIDMWDNKPDAPEGIRGEFKPIDTNAERHPDRETPAEDGRRSMDKATIVRSLYHTIPSHGPATVFMTTGNKPTAGAPVPGARLAGVEAAADRNRRAAVRHASASSATARPGRPATSAPAYNPFIVEGNGGGGGKGGAAAGGGFRVRGITLPNGFTLEELEKRDKLLRKLRHTGSPASTSRNDLVDGLDTFHQQALEILRSRQDPKAFDLDQREAERPASCTATTPFGQGALAARRLVEAGVRFVTVSLGGWDTHSQTFNAHKTRLLPTTRPDAVGPDRATWTSAACWTARS